MTNAMDEVIGDMDVKRETITAPDGREIEFVTAGPAAGTRGLNAAARTAGRRRCRGHRGGAGRARRRGVQAIVGEWGFALDDPAMPPVAVWHGDQDRMVACAHGEWLARNVAGARAHLMPGEGHLSLVATAMGDILDDLTGMAGL
jgi:pimeloyl-ACP methyl ester carboxylesterase